MIVLKSFTSHHALHSMKINSGSPAYDFWQKNNIHVHGIKLSCSTIINALKQGKKSDHTSCTSETLEEIISKPLLSHSKFS